MATNTISTGSRVNLISTAAHNSGDFVVESGLHGQCVNAVSASGLAMVLDISQQVVRLPAYTTPAVGDLVYMDLAGALSTTATSNRLVGKVVGVPITPGTALEAYNDIPAGQMDMLVGPQTTAAATA